MIQPQRILVVDDNSVTSNRALSVNQFDLLALHRGRDAVALPDDDLFLTIHHARKINFGFTNLNAKFRRSAHATKQIQPYRFVKALDCFAIARNEINTAQR